MAQKLPSHPKASSITRGRSLWIQRNRFGFFAEGRLFSVVVASYCQDYSFRQDRQRVLIVNWLAGRNALAIEIRDFGRQSELANLPCFQANCSLWRQK